MDMYHTGVPTAFRGQGIAKILAKVSHFLFLKIYFAHVHHYLTKIIFHV